MVSTVCAWQAFILKEILSLALPGSSSPTSVFLTKMPFLDGTFTKSWQSIDLQWIKVS